MSNLTLLRPGMLADGDPPHSVETTEQSALYVPHFDPSLIQRLIQDHRQMMDHLQTADACLARNQHKLARASLVQLQALLEQHFKLEFEQVYSRLEAAQTFPEGRRPSDLMREERTQAKQMFAFFGGYVGADLRGFNNDGFKDAFHRFSLELIEHTEREERELFPFLVRTEKSGTE